MIARGRGNCWIGRANVKELGVCGVNGDCVDDGGAAATVTVIGAGGGDSGGGDEGDRISSSSSMDLKR